MEISIKKRAMLFSGTSNPQLAMEIADHLGMSLEEVEITRFASSEIKVRFPASVRGVDAFVIQTHCFPVNDMIMEQLIMLDALKRASAKRINAVIPFYGYARQDRKAIAREPISARLLADLLEVAGADRVLSVDLHTQQIQGFFNIPVDHLTAVPLIADYIEEKYRDDLVVVAPDANGATLAAKYAHHLEAGMAILEKRRHADRPNVTETVGMVGEVEGKRCVIVDDMIDTAGTLVGGAKWLLERGASEVIAAATHAVFSPPAADRLRDSEIKEIVVTNTLPMREEDSLEQVTVLSIAPSLAATIKAVFEDESVSEIFQGEHMEYIPPEYKRG